MSRATTFIFKDSVVAITPIGIGMLVKLGTSAEPLNEGLDIINDLFGGDLELFRVGDKEWMWSQHTIPLTVEKKELEKGQIYLMDIHLIFWTDVFTGEGDSRTAYENVRIMELIEPGGTGIFKR